MGGSEETSAYHEISRSKEGWAAGFGRRFEWLSVWFCPGQNWLNTGQESVEGKRADDVVQLLQRAAAAMPIVCTNVFGLSDEPKLCPQMRTRMAHGGAFARCLANGCALPAACSSNSNGCNGGWARAQCG